jgi:hypothetical protein
MICNQILYISAAGKGIYIKFSHFYNLKLRYETDEEEIEEPASQRNSCTSTIA